MRILTVALPLFFFFNAQSQIKKLKAETAIENVTIFSSGARVERRASVNIQSGRTEISFGGLSNQLDQQTVQLKADAGIVLLSVQTMKDFLTERKVAEQEQQYIDHVNAVKDKLELDQKQMDVYKNEEAMLIKNQAIGGQAGVRTSELKEALEFQRQRLTEVYNKELEIQKRLVFGQQDFQKGTTQLQEFSKKKDSISYIVTALVESKETRTIDFQLFYNVKDAGSLSLSLGKDNGINVTRKLIKEYSTKRFIGSNRTESRQYEISIRNSKRLSANISLVDQIPVSTNKEISVEEAKAAEAQIDKDTGLVTWIFTLPAGQEKKLGISYNVKYPKDRKLILE